MARPECTCEPFVFAEDKPWEFRIHQDGCPVICKCTWRGYRGNIVHHPECGWYEEPKPANPKAIKGARPLFMIIDEVDWP